MICALVPSTLFAGTGREIPAVIDTPFAISPLAERAMMLDVTKAGTRLVAVGDRGYILISDDDGKTWTQVQSPTGVTLVNVEFSDGKNGWAVGHMGVVIATKDGGSSWVEQLDGVKAAQLVLKAAKTANGEGSSVSVDQAAFLVEDGPDKPLFALLASSNPGVIAAGAFGLVLEKNGKNGWSSAIDEFDNPGGMHIYGFAEAGRAVYAAGEQGLFLRSQNGRKFERISVPYEGTFWGVLAPNEETVILYGLRGTVLWSDDQGENWRQVSVGTSATVSAAASLADGKMLLGTYGRELFLGDAEGKTFSKVAAIPWPVTGFVQALDGSIIVTGAGGVTRIAMPHSIEEH